MTSRPARAGRRRLLLLGVPAALTLGVGAVAWVLSRGVDLAFAVPALERALGRPGAFTVRIGSAELVWADRRPALRASDIHVLGLGGAPVASVPAIVLRPSLRALLRGTIALGTIELDGARLRLVRTAAGGFDLGLGEDARSGTPELLGRLVPSRGPDAWLRRLDVRHAEIVVVEPASSWRAVGVELSLEPGRDGVRAALRGDVYTGVGGIFVPVRGEFVYRPDGSVADVHFGPVAPASASMLFPESLRPIFGGVGVPIAGSARLELDGRFDPRRIQVSAEGDAGIIAMPGLLPVAVAVRGVRGSAVLDLAADTLAVENLVVDLPDARVEAHGTLADLHGARRLEAETRISHFRVGDIATYWPVTLAPAARDWVTKLSAGSLRHGVVRVTGRMANGAPAGIDASGSASFEKLAVCCLDVVPPVRDLAGTVTFGADRWRVRVARGAVGDLQVVHGTVEVDVAGRRSTVRAAVRGQVPAALAVVQRAQAGRSPGLAGAEGTVDADVRVDVPLRSDLRADEVAVSVSARTHRAAVPHVFRGWSFSDGELEIDFHDRALSVVGEGRVEGAPVTLAWKEDAGGGRRVHVTARLDSAERAALGIDVRRWIDGPVRVRALLLQKQAAGTLEVSADLSEASLALPVLAVDKPPGGAGSADARVVLARGVATDVERLHFTAGGAAVRGRAALAAGGTALRSLDLSATVVPREVGRPPGHVTFALGPGGEGAHPFVLTSDDAGALFRAIAPAADATGGRLRYAGTLDLRSTGTPIDGRLELRDFRLVRSPLLARVATLASLAGIADLLRGRGITFDRLEAGIASRGTTVTLTDAVARGPSANLLVAGTIERSDWTASLRGTLAPSLYGVNTGVGRVPVLGALVTGERREGIQAFDFDVTGPVQSPRVTVRLTSLAPGVLRDLARRVPGVRR